MPLRAAYYFSPSKSRSSSANLDSLRWSRDLMLFGTLPKYFFEIIFHYLQPFRQPYRTHLLLWITINNETGNMLRVSVLIQTDVRRYRVICKIWFIKLSKVPIMNNFKIYLEFSIQSGIPVNKKQGLPSRIAPVGCFSQLIC